MEREILKCVRQVERFGEYFWQMLSLFPLYISRLRGNTCSTCMLKYKWIGQLRKSLRGCAPQSKAKNILKCTLQMERFGGMMFLTIFIL